MELDQQKQTLSSLLKEREELMFKLKESKFDEEAFLSFQNCYVETSIKLGHCSREWQNWWEGGDSNCESCIPDNDDNFSKTMNRLAKKVKSSMEVVQSSSYFRIKETIENLNM